MIESKAARIGVAALVAGLAAAALTFFFMAVLRREPPTLLLAVVAPLVGMTLELVLRPKPASDVKQDAPKRSAQLVGQTCPVCQKKIKTTLDAESCVDCSAAVHVDCFEEHECA